MALLRELVTRFSFDIDEEGEEKYNKTIGRMKSGARSLAKLLGISLGIAGAKSAFSFGKTAIQAEADLKRLAGTDFSKLQNQLASVKKGLEGVREGASRLVRDKVFNVMAASFVKEFGAGEENIKNFRKMFEAAVLHSAVTGKGVPEIFSGFMETVKSGGFGSFKGLPGFDINKQKFIEFQQQARDPKEPGGRIGRAQRQQFVNLILSVDMMEKMAKRVKALDDSLFDTALIKRTNQDAADKLAESSVKALEPATKEISNFSNEVATLIDNIKKEGFIKGIGKSFDPHVDAANDRQAAFNEKLRLKRLKELNDKNDLPKGSIESIKDLISDAHDAANERQRVFGQKSKQDRLKDPNDQKGLLKDIVMGIREFIDRHKDLERFPGKTPLVQKTAKQRVEPDRPKKIKVPLDDFAIGTREFIDVFKKINSPDQKTEKQLVIPITREAGRDRESKVSSGKTVITNNLDVKINIKTDDSRAAGIAVKQEMQKLMNTTKAQNIPIEDR